MKIKIVDYEKNAARVIDYPGTIKLYIGVHFGAWGFYTITRDGRAYHVTDRFTGELLYTVAPGGRG